MGRKTWKDFEKATLEGVDVGLLPCGSLEPHGMHLPLGTDGYIAHGSVTVSPCGSGHRGASDFLGGLRSSYNITAVPGTHTMDDADLINLYLSAAASMARYGVRRFLLMNGHAGNAARVKSPPGKSD
jgi:creatinine amidohydrolase